MNHDEDLNRLNILSESKQATNLRSIAAETTIHFVANRPVSWKKDNLSKNVIRILLKKEVIVQDEDDPDSVFFSPKITSDEVFKKRLGSIENPEKVLDIWQPPPFSTITEAIKAATHRDRIFILPGVYQESLVIDKQLEIIGQNDSGEVKVQATEADVISFQANMGRVANLTLEQIGKGNYYAIDIMQGRLELEDCDITGEGGACVGIHGGADPFLRRNKIHGGKHRGVYVHDNGQGTLEENDIFNNACTGVLITTYGNPTLRNNRIHSGKEDGVLVGDKGQGVLEENDIFNNEHAGVAVLKGGKTVLRRNRIYTNQTDGVYIGNNSSVTLDKNKIYRNGHSGVAILGGDSNLDNNEIYANRKDGVYIGNNGYGQ